jgi:hypothetical protein
MEKVIIFVSDLGGVEVLEKKLNDWFKANPKIRITDRLQSESSLTDGTRPGTRRVTISIFYQN